MVQCMTGGARTCTISGGAGLVVRGEVGSHPVAHLASARLVTIEIDGQKLLAHTKVRRDRVDKTGAFTLRYRSKLDRMGLGRKHRGKRILILVADLDLRISDEEGVTIRHLELGSFGRLSGPGPRYRLKVRLSQKC